MLCEWSPIIKVKHSCSDIQYIAIPEKHVLQNVLMNLQSFFVDLLLEATVIITRYNSYSIVFCMFTSNVLDSIVTTAGTPIKVIRSCASYINFSHHT